MAKRWTKEEESALLLGVGTYGIDWLQKHTGDSYNWPNALAGRSRAALYAKARRLYGGGGLLRGSYTLNAIVLESGYSRTQLFRARRALDQKWRRGSPRSGNYLINEDQRDELLAWLKNDYWSKRHRLYNCFWCHQDSRAHRALGLCVLCYNKYYRWYTKSGILDTKQYIERNPEIPTYWKDKTMKAVDLGRAIPCPVVQMLGGEIYV